MSEGYASVTTGGRAKNVTYDRISAIHRIVPITDHVSMAGVSVHPDLLEVTVTRSRVRSKPVQWKHAPSSKPALSSAPVGGHMSEVHVYVQVDGKEQNVNSGKNNAKDPDAFALPAGSVIDVNSKPVTRVVWKTAAVTMERAFVTMDFMGNTAP